MVYPRHIACCAVTMCLTIFPSALASNFHMMFRIHNLNCIFWSNIWGTHCAPTSVISSVRLNWTSVYDHSVGYQKHSDSTICNLQGQCFQQHDSFLQAASDRHSEQGSTWRLLPVWVPYPGVRHSQGSAKAAFEAEVGGLNHCVQNLDPPEKNFYNVLWGSILTIP